MKRLAILCLAACGLVAPSSAQEPTPTPSKLPAGPLLNRAPDFSQWTITSKEAVDVLEAATPETQPKAEPSAMPSRRQKTGEASAKKPIPPVEPTTVVTKTLSVRHEETTPVTGAKIQRWCVPDMQVTISGEAAPVVSTPGNAADSAYVDYSKTDFPEFEWIAESDFTGTKTVMGQECLIFEGRPTLKRKAADPAPAKATASINSATRLPVALQTEDQLLTYRFELAPTAMVVPPPEVAELIEKWRKTMEQSALMPSKP